MKTYPVENKDRFKIAFEIENIYVSYRTIANLLAGLDSVKKICSRKLFSSSEYLVEFKYKDVDCVVWEPYGDSSRYWIGPKNPDSEKVELNDLEAAFNLYMPHPIIKIFGDILSLNFLNFTSKKGD